MNDHSLSNDSPLSEPLIDRRRRRRRVIITAHQSHGILDRLRQWWCGCFWPMMMNNNRCTNHPTIIFLIGFMTTFGSACLSWVWLMTLKIVRSNQSSTHPFYFFFFGDLVLFLWTFSVAVLPFVVLWYSVQRPNRKRSDATRNDPKSDDRVVAIYSFGFGAVGGILMAAACWMMTGWTNIDPYMKAMVLVSLVSVVFACTVFPWMEDPSEEEDESSSFTNHQDSPDRMDSSDHDDLDDSTCCSLDGSLDNSLDSFIEESAIEMLHLYVQVI